MDFFSLENLIKFAEITATLSGVLYVVLEVLQKNLMWYVGIVSVVCCAFSFSQQGEYVAMSLNIYYVLMSIWGLLQWKKDQKKVDSESFGKDVNVRLNRLPLKVVIGSILIFCLVILSAYGLQKLALSLCSHSVIQDSSFYSILHAFSVEKLNIVELSATTVAVIGTYWLAKSYLEQWILWVICDILFSILCFESKLYWMTGLYAIYSLAAVYGLFHWKKLGTYID